MHDSIHLGDLVALILVNNKNIPRFDGIELVVNEKLLSAGDGIVNLIAVMDVHVHGFFFLIQMCYGKGLGLAAVFYGLFAGRKFSHWQGILS